MLSAKYEDRDLTHLPPLTDRVLEHVDWIRQSGPSAAPGIVRSLTDLASVEAIQFEEGNIQC